MCLASTLVTGKKFSATCRNWRKMTVFRGDQGEGLVGPSGFGACGQRRPVYALESRKLKGDNKEPVHTELEQ